MAGTRVRCRSCHAGVIGLALWWLCGFSITFPALAPTPRGSTIVARAGTGKTPNPPGVSQIPSWKVDQFGKLDPTPWERDQLVTDYVNELKGIMPLKAGDAGAENVLLADRAGVLIYPLKTYLHKRESKNRWLFVRKHSKQVWDEVLARNFDRSAVIGSPGIGKSFSSAYFIKKLLEMDKVVVYEARQDDQVYIFLPPGSDGDNKDYRAYCVPAGSWVPQSCPALKEANNYYFVDPAEAGSSKGPAQVDAHTVIDVSVDTQQLGEFRKIVERFYMGPWLQEEVLAVRPFLLVAGQALTEDEVKMQFWFFGGVLRNIFSNPSSQSWAMKKARNVLMDERLVKDVWAKDIDALGTRDDDKPPSALFVLEPVDCVELASEIFQAKPEAFRPFAEAQVAIVSEWGRCALVHQYWEDLQADLDKVTHKTAVSVGWLFEDAGHIALARGGRFPCRDLETEELSVLQIPKRKLTVRRGGLQQFLVEAMADASRGYYVVPQNPKMPILDAAEGGTDEVYQITINRDHKLNNELLMEALAAMPGRRVLLSWVVPQALFKRFTARSLPTELQSRVRQRVLLLRPVLPPMEYGQY